MRHIGIDPGKAGGIAWIDDDGPHAEKMPATERDIWELIAGLEDHDAFALIEWVWSSPQMGVAGAFSFGSSSGGLRMALIASGIPFDKVTPAKWQRSMRCLTKGDKNVSKAKAQELFPSLKITHANADSLLIAEYCRRITSGNTAENK